MDSITHIVLGAAVGQAVLGKKLGNRAMWWGAVAATIPDLDVVANLFFPEMLALAFHRHITHSILFAAVGGFAFAWLVHKYYESGLFRQSWMVNLKGVLFVLAIVLYTLLIGALSWWLRGVNALFWMIPIAVIIFFVTRYYIRSFIVTLHHPPHGVSLLNWFWLFFFCFITHALLDVFTPYGTQVFQPFSDYRAAFNNIAVVDPLYTIPLIVAMGLLIFLRRDNPLRTKINMAGLVVSSLYMIFTIGNKLHTNSIFEDTLQQKGIEVIRYTTSPGLMTNFLWNAVAETDTGFIIADYSNFDPKKQFSNFIFLPKNHEYIKPYMTSRDVQIVIWFSKGFYKVDLTDNPNLFYLSDLRYGSLGSHSEDEYESVFRFFLDTSDDKPQVGQTRERPEITGKMWNTYWQRVFGNPDALSNLR